MLEVLRKDKQYQEQIEKILELSKEGICKGLHLQKEENKNNQKGK